jgi:hypothetical protein
MSSDFLLTRLSVSELSQKILEMATTGVYRESIFEALQPATKKQIREAINHAKRFGLCSVASLRDPELGTYYQLDVAKYKTLQHALHSPVHLGKDVELVQRLTAMMQTLEQMLNLAKSLAGLLSLLTLLCWVSGWHSVSWACFSAAVSAIVLWQVQRQLVNRMSQATNLKTDPKA